jgi:hypothetical protein
MWGSAFAPGPASAERSPIFSITSDNFYCNPDQRAAMIAEEPAQLDNALDHAMLGAIAEHLARRWNLPVIPAWTDDPSRFLHEPFFTTPIKALWPMLREESPPAFRRRKIYTEAEPLRRARMPR